MADKFKRYGVPVRLENTPIFKRILQKLMNKVSGGTAGNFAMLDADGNVVDSGKSANDFAPNSENGYVEKLTNTTDVRAYVNSPLDGALSLLVVRAENTPFSLAQRTAAGCIYTAAPTNDLHAATKKYVDDAIAALKAELTQ